MSKRKILFLGKLPPPYIGPAIATSIILNSKLKDNFQLIHLDTSDHRDINTLGAIDFTNIYLALKQYWLLFWLLLTRWPDIVYIPNKQTTIGYLQDAPFIIISKLFRRKVVCHLRGGNFKNWYDSATIFTKWLVRKVHFLVDCQIVLGHNLRHLFNWLLPEEKIVVIPNGGDFDIKLVPQNGSPKIRILYLANFHRSKGVLDVLKAIPDVHNHYPKVEFVFAGSWRDEPTKAEFQLFLRENPDLPISVKGVVSGELKYELFATSDIFVFPSYYPAEGHPWVIVEAMAAGLPIISTDHGAIIQSVVNGENGFIVEKQNPHQIADKIKLLIDKAGLRKSMGARSRELYLQNFTEEKMIERLTHAFEIVLSDGKPAEKRLPKKHLQMKYSKSRHREAAYPKS